MNPSLKPPLHVAVTGAGASALSLAWHLRNVDSVEAIQLIAPDFKPRSDKTWCFWNPDAVIHPDILTYSWKRLSVIGPEGDSVTELLQKRRYYCVRSDQYQRVLLEEIRKSPKVKLTEARVTETGYDSSTGKSRILTEMGAHQSDLVFTSHIRPPDNELYSPEKVALRQHFMGWDIHTNRDLFNPDEAILMDFRTDQSDGFAFVYVLPFGPRSALVEITYFTPELLDRKVYTRRLMRYLQEHWRLLPADGSAGNTALQEHDAAKTASEFSEFTIEREEFGVIPMSEGYTGVEAAHPVYPIGLAGGTAKASSGYAFSRIQSDMNQIATALSRGDLPSDTGVSPFRHRLYDLMMLKIIRDNPTHAVQVFMALFRKIGFESMLRFLDEETDFAEELRVMASVPSYKQFFKALWSVRHRIPDQWFSPRAHSGRPQ